MSKRKGTRLRSEFGESREAKIEALFACGLPTEAVWKAMEVEYPSIVQGCKQYDADLRGKISRAINSTKGLLKKAQADDDELLEFAGKGELVNLDDIKAMNIRRFSGGPGIDYVYGKTEVTDLTTNEKTGETWEGMPYGYVSIWGGAPNVGKTRLAVTVAAHVVESGNTVLYAYGESRKEQFKQWTRGIQTSGRFWVST